ncbi:MAG: pilus assembly protein PilM [bacterium]|nr:pilus assembly protein PilM [bacterium]
MVKALFQKLKDLFPHRMLAQLLTPSAGPIGGLEITDSHVRFFDIHKNKISALGIRLPPGIIHGGRLMDAENFKKALVGIRTQLGLKEKTCVILTVPSEVAYLKVFALPFLSGDNLRSAINLNLQMISPIPYEEAYADSEVIGETVGNENQLEILGAFSEKENLERIINATKDAGFVVVAVEPSILALARAVHDFGGLESPESYTLLNATEVGMDFAEIKNKRVYFNYFVSWHSIYGDAREVPKDIFEQAVIQYTRKILTFAASHGGANIKILALVATALGDSLKEIIEKNFDLKVTPVIFGQFKNFGPNWGAALGAYRRGLLPRSEDFYVSLMSFGTQEEFKRSQIVAYVSLWRNVVTTFLVFLFVAFTATAIFVAGVANDLKRQPAQGLRPEEVQDLKKFEASAKEFNELVALIQGALKNDNPLYPYYQKLVAVTPSDIILRRAFFQSFGSPVVVSGEGASEQAVINFKNILEKQKEFKEIQLPLTSFSPIGAGRVSFSMTLSFAPEKAE